MCMLETVLKLSILVMLKIIGEIFYYTFKAICYPLVLVYLPVMKLLVRTYIRALIRMKKIHAFVFKYVISMYYSKGPSSMLIKDILDEEIARSQRGY